MVEQLICNQLVVGSNPTPGSLKRKVYMLFKLLVVAIFAALVITDAIVDAYRRT